MIVNVHGSHRDTLNGGESSVSQTDTEALREAFDLAARNTSAAEARHRTLAWLLRHSVGQEPAEAAVLVISELVTNAVVHSGSSVISCTLRLGGGLLHIEVTDQGTGQGEPAVREPSADDVSGRGLLLVSALSKGWGVSPASPSGLTVWAIVPLAD
jgi:anti-sigma regulatory factor (Ser/Thr protein kinase)